MKKVVVIDPGHGDKGGDFGAVGADGTREADVVLDIGLLLRKLLEHDGFRVVMTRELPVSRLEYTDSQVGDLPARVRLSYAMQADAFISLHCNSAASKTAEGLEVWHYPEPQSQRLAHLVMNELAYQLSCKVKTRGWSWWARILNRGKKASQSLYVLRGTNCPTILTELLFLSNPMDLQLLKLPETKTMFAVAIAGAVNKYLKEG